MTRPVLTILLSLTLAGAAGAQEKEGDKTLDKAGEIATQPVRDVGIQKTEIPEVLTRAVSQPYASPGSGCRTLIAQIAELNEVLGPDFGGNSKENEDKFGKLAAAGGEAVVNSLIPFRGLVREVSGAAPAERRFDAAVNAGLARRGYLRGLAVSRGCKLPPPPVVKAKDDGKKKDEKQK
ncbi:hypothetical protein [Sphingobium lignivorans]|uniref:Uncharacterized protein n=1 Tax=Sphingobium lignivorans TaxID=2735886 RepID=A0ABR6NKU9_9SPHN|nr:hypothetical protein [Sphingobium lignivorans]MBB5987902.1 hypothetical protein [Sphingobium lignivorans]